MKYRILSLLPLAVVISTSIFTISPLFANGFFPMHDDTQPARVYEMVQALADGQFPVRIVRDLGYGYGYPLFNFYGPLPYYIGAVFNLLGFSVISSTKIMMGLGMVLAGISMYFLAKKVTGKSSVGVIASAAYLFAPYHAVQLYVRGAIGELYAYAFMPIPLLGWYLIMKRQFIKGISVGSIGFFLVFISHTVSALIMLYISLLLLLALLVCYIQKKISLYAPLAFAATVMIGIALAAFFLIPALFEQNFTSVSLLVREGSNFRSHYVYLTQLWDSTWGFAGSAPGLSDGMSFKIGKLHLLLSVLSLLALYWQYSRNKLPKSHWILGISFWSLAVMAVFLMLAVSQPLWEIIPFFPFIQYPWRFLNFTLLGLCMLIALGIRYSPVRINTVVTVLIVFSFVLLNQRLFTPSYIYESVDSLYTSTTNLSGKLSKISDEYLPLQFRRDKYPDNIGWRTVWDSTLLPNFNNLEIKSNYRSFGVAVQTRGFYTAPLAYFPGWITKVDGVDEQIKEHNGLMTIELQKSNHLVELFFIQTPIEKLSNLISLLSVILLLYLSLFWKRKAHEETLG